MLRHRGCLDQFSKEGRCITLVLSRKTSERILIGPDIVVTVVRIGPNTVRLGIEAPGEMNIVRDELTESENKHGDRD